jgi:hypothetical protein
VIRAPTIPPKIAFANHAMANISSSLIVSAAADSRASRRGGRSAFGSHHASPTSPTDGVGDAKLLKSLECSIKGRHLYGALEVKD